MKPDPVVESVHISVSEAIYEQFVLGMSLGCGWRRQPPDMEDSCKYIE